MIIKRIGSDYISIEGENPIEKVYLEKQVGWQKPNTLKKVISKLEAYEVDEITSEILSSHPKL